ncbi:nedd8 activating enzyme [Nannochloropsis gaditana]|uniref:NEDD8-activating enzyme E1 catalytic subunit n=2 Tax=Nannochloropsis gaditana TaxID=72520 RepID=W7TVT9_9STRA|nr:nedd8 activating enzyme [Nannochloropsis gaditana]
MKRKMDMEITTVAKPSNDYTATSMHVGSEAVGETAAGNTQREGSSLPTMPIIDPSSGQATHSKCESMSQCRMGDKNESRQAEGERARESEEGACDDGMTDMDNLLLRPSPFAADSGSLALGEFEAGADLKEMLAEARVLVVGAGGLGCEILKNLALSGVKDIDLIDLDTVELSNLNRQFLFREKDIGQPKAVVAAKFIMERVPGVRVRPHHGKIQDKDAAFYKQFSIVIAGLDNIKARIWLNSTLFSLAERSESSEKDDSVPPYDLATVIPLVDGGTEGFQGQARVILPGLTACFHCTLDLFPPAQSFQLCTLADTPRQPEHCVAYAQILLWPEAHPEGTVLDPDIPEHVAWVWGKAKERARQFGIEGITYRLTLGVIKNIIPAVASTNAVVAAVSVNEAIKILTFMSQVMNNYMMYQGPEGIYTYTTAHQRKDDCLVCGSRETHLSIAPTLLLSDVLHLLKSNASLQLTAPSLTCGNKVLYMQRPPALEAATRENLSKKISELLPLSGEALSVTDPSVNQPVTVILKYE